MSLFGSTCDAAVIVVGSGPAGVSAAWPLVRAGVQVLMIDPSGQTSGLTAPPVARVRPNPDPSRGRFGADLASLVLPNAQSPKFSTARGREVVAGYAEKLDLESRGFFVAGSLGRGGLSAMWGGLAARYDDDNFQGLPFTASEFAPFYDAVSRRIGLETPNESMVSEAARRVLQRHRAAIKGKDFHLIPAPNAVLSKPLDGRAACTQCGRCLFGCDLKSIYNSADEVPFLQLYPNFRYAPDHLVDELGREGDLQILRTQTNQGEHILRARYVVLAAGTVATTALGLGRLNLVDQPVRMLSNPTAATAFVLPDLLGKKTSSSAISLGQLFFRSRRIAGSAAAGVLYGADALPLNLLAARLPFSRPVALRLAQALSPALLMATYYLPGSFSQNYLTVSRNGARKKILIEGRQTEDAKAALTAGLADLGLRLLNLGAVRAPGSTSILEPGADAHLAGTLPMGGDGAGATSAYGELVGASGVFVADGAALPALAATHPTLTIMANATRIADHIVQRIASRGDDVVTEVHPRKATAA